MTDFTILHVSDLHWSKSKANDQRIVVDALINDLRAQKAAGLKPDLVLFTGDLVQAGDDASSFQSVHEHFLSRLISETAPAPIVLTPGNHDIQREVVRASGGFIEVGLRSQLQSVDTLNSFIDDVIAGKSATVHAMERLGNYETAAASFGQPPATRDGPLLKTFKISMKGLSIGIASFNTAWRATGESDNVDRHTLLLGERNVDLAAEDLKECDLKIAMFHHPLDWLADFDNISVSSRAYSEFDLLAYGHSHRSEPETRVTTVGTAVVSQAGCLYEHRDYFNGYQFIKFRLDDNEVDFHVRCFYNRPRRAFDKAVNIVPEGLVTFPYMGRSKNEKEPVSTFLRVARPIIRQAATEQVNIVEAVSDLRLDPKEAFICPPLTAHRTSAVTSPDKPSSEEELPAEKLLRERDSFLIVGPRESGKSTLAHYLAVLAAEGAIDRPRIPAVLDFRQLKLSSYGLTRAIATYFGTSKQGLDIEKRLSEGDFLIIVDNFSGRDKASRDGMNALVRQYPDCRWIMLADARPGAPIVEEDKDDLLAGFRAVHIQTLPRRSIRELSRRWCEPVGIDNQKAFTAVMAQLRHANLPRTGYMVTLLLWALYKERKFERINEALLLTYVIDYLLGKADLSRALENFDPPSKEITLQHLSKFLRASFGIAHKNDVVVELVNFFAQKGLQYDAVMVLEQLISCGLLKDSAGTISFKYRCFEEYFFASALRNNADELSAAMQKRHFVEYARELELLSGLRRQNKDILDIITAELKSGAPVELIKFGPLKFDEIARSESGGGLTRRKLEDIRKKKLSADQIDDLMDAADNEASKRQIGTSGGKNGTQKKNNVTPQSISDDTGNALDTTPMHPLDFVASVDLLGRILRNSEFTDADDKISAAETHLNCTIRLMLLYADIFRGLLNELGKEREGRILISKDDIVAVRYIMLKVLFQITSTNITEQAGTEKLFSIFETLISRPDITTVEEILLSMTLLDLNHPKWLSYWEHCIDRAKNNRFSLDLLMERLWHVIHTKPLSESERRRVEAAAEKIEAAFGASRQARTETVKIIRDAAKETTRQERGA